MISFIKILQEETIEEDIHIVLREIEEDTRLREEV
jgi:hypothetical protein